MNSQNTGDSLVSYLAATAPALLQLIAVLSVGLVNVLKLDKFVLSPDFINIANFLVILLSISLISLASFWDYNKFTFVKAGESIFSKTKDFWFALKISFTIACLSLLTFIGIVINKSAISGGIGYWTFLQWSTYIIGMVSVSFIIYAFALLKLQERSNRGLYENFIPRLVDSLRRYGHVKTPEIIIENVDRKTDPPTAIVKLGAASKYKVETDFTGEMISIEGLKNSE